MERWERVKDRNHPVHSVPYAYDEQGNPISQYDPKSMDIGHECPYECGGSKVYMGHGGIGCTTDDCIANTASAMQGSDLPQGERGKSQTQVGEATPTNIRSEFVDPNEETGNIFFDMLTGGKLRPDPNKPKEEPYIEFTLPKPQAIFQQLDAAGQPLQSFADMRHPDIRTGYPMNLSWRLLKKDPRLERAGVEGYNKPKRTPDHPKKSHIVVARSGGKTKTIRFGEQGASVAGKPKAGESARMKAKRKSFKSRHAKNIARGPMSAAYWADKVKW